MIEIRTERSDGARIVRIEGSLGPEDDPTALVGLPLIRTCRLIRAAGVRVLP